ncbi:MAG: cyanophycinase [Pyrinomonadaceae bacterium]|nr:cyanophycinase [Pyrinomonadaceae bacterium]
MIVRIAFLFIAFLLGAPSALPQTTTGPDKGTLIVHGGGRMQDDIAQKFIELAGCDDGKIVVVPTAAGGDNFGERSLEIFKKYGARNVTLLHTRDRKTANSEEFIKPLKEATAVWFGGGRQWRLVDAYSGTKAEEAFREVLERGGVVGGSSAGATIQGSFLARGDTRNNQIMSGDHKNGFGYIKNVAIDQHVIARNRQFDMFDILKERPELLGLGIDENTAIIVKKNEFEVVGENYVVVYDGTFWSREGTSLKTVPKAPFYFLRRGDRYDLANRKVIPRRR